MDYIERFVDRFSESSMTSLIKPETVEDISNLERRFEIKLPNDYKIFLKNYGNIWTPTILDKVVDNDLNFYDVQQFWSIEAIILDIDNGWTAQTGQDILPFASDCSGNLFCFTLDDLRSGKNDCEIHFYDHDFDTFENLSKSFKEWIEQYNEI